MDASLFLSLKMNEWVGMVTAIAGTLLSVTTLVLAQRQRTAEARAKAARDHIDALERRDAERRLRDAPAAERAQAEQDAMRERAEAERVYEHAKSAMPWRRRISFKAVAAASIGTMTLLGAALVLAAADVSGETVTTEDTIGLWFWAVVAVVLGLSARRDVKSAPGRHGIKLAWVGIGTAVFAALASVQAPQNAVSGTLPNLVVGVLDDCTGYRVGNDGSSPVEGFQAVGSNGGGSTPFAHAGLGAGQLADTAFFSTGEPSVGLTTVTIDPANAIAESNESDNFAQRQC
jgi:hypothetical protein